MMTMFSATLKDQLVLMELYGSEADAIQAWTTAWANYFLDAESNGIPILAPTVELARQAMAAAMVGISTAGAAAIQAGIIQFWAILVASPAVVFAGCIGITIPGGLGGIASALQPVFDTNTSTSADEETAYDNLASLVLHPNNLGGQATFPGPLNFPIL